jgi:hypothetical protein
MTHYSELPHLGGTLRHAISLSQKLLISSTSSPDRWQAAQLRQVNQHHAVRSLIKLADSQYATIPVPTKGKYRDMVKVTRVKSHGLNQVHCTYGDSGKTIFMNRPYAWPHPGRWCSNRISKKWKGVLSGNTNEGVWYSRELQSYQLRGQHSQCHCPLRAHEAWTLTIGVLNQHLWLVSNVPNCALCKPWISVDPLALKSAEKTSQKRRVKQYRVY